MASREKGLGSSSTNPARSVPRRRAAFIATAPPKEWPTRARGRRPRCWKSPSTSSAWSVRVCGRLGGQLELSPYPNRSTATTWKRDASSPVRERHCCLPLTELCTRMTGSPAPDASNPTRQRPDWIADTDIPPIGGPVLPVLLMPAAYSGAVVAWRIPDDGPAGCPCLGPAPGCSSVACRCRHRAHDRACPSATVVGVRCGKSGSGCCRACLVRLGVVVQHATGSEERPAAAAAAGEGGAMRIAVYGAGGVGGYFGGRLAQAGGGPAGAAAGRGHRGGVAAKRGRQRGEARPRRRPGPRDGRGRVHLRRDQRAGRDRAHRRADHLTFGELDGRRTERAQRLLACYQQAGVAAELSPAIKTVLWAKLAFICAQAGMTAAVRLPIGEIRTVDAAWAAFQRLVAEVAAVAEADGTPVPPAALERALTLAQGVEPGSFSSLHDDLVAGRRMELEALHGFVVRRAAEPGVPVPTSQAIYAILKPWAVRNERTER